MIDLGGFRPFDGEEHRPFTWEGGRPAALLVHGFPGTPAEMRPLAAGLHAAGWTVQAPLLPGFGPEIATIDTRLQAEWVGSAGDALALLAEAHRPILVAGYSVGAAIAIQAAAAAAVPPGGLVLLAPFRQIGTPWQRAVWTFLRPFVPALAPLRKADLADPRLRALLDEFLPGIDLADPAVQQAVRRFRVPARLVDEVIRAGRAAAQAAARVRCPALVIQGEEDEVVRPRVTRGLVRRLAGSAQYLPVRAGHDLLNPEQPAWPQVERAILDFAGRLWPPSQPQPVQRGTR